MDSGVPVVHRVTDVSMKQKESSFKPFDDSDILFTEVLSTPAIKRDEVLVHNNVTAAYGGDSSAVDRMEMYRMFLTPTSAVTLQNEIGRGAQALVCEFCGRRERVGAEQSNE